MSARADVAVLHRGPDQVGESPLWDPSEGALWWVDIRGRAIRRLDMASGRVVHVETPFMPGALALGGDGPIVAGGTGWYRLEAGGTLSPVAEAEPEGAVRMNDGVVDSAGRFWAGTVPLRASATARGSLYRLDADGPRKVLDGLRTQNGCAVSPDGRTFYLAESHPEVRSIWAFDFDVATGELSNRRLFHRPERGRPDGAAVDAEGCYWFAAIDAGRIVRLDPAGREMQAIALPASRPTNLAFCGEDLAMLAITTMSAGPGESDSETQPLAGALLGVEAGVAGWPQPLASRLPASPFGRKATFELASSLMGGTT